MPSTTMPDGYAYYAFTACTATTAVCWTPIATTADSTAFYYPVYRDPVLVEQRRCERERKQFPVAYEKADKWLSENLSSEQQVTLETERFFEVIGSKTRRRYRIRAGLSGVRNVSEMKQDGDKWIAARTLCFHPDGKLPEGDILLTQKALLENDEEYVRKVANFS